MSATEASVAAYERFFRSFKEAVVADPEMPLERSREVLEHWGDLAAEPQGVDYRVGSAGGVEVLWATPAEAAVDRVIVCSHGGGYSCGSMHSHRKVYGHVARATGCRAMIVNFRRVPEHPYPAPLEDVYAAFGTLLAEGIAGERIALVGDSAGAALSLAVARQAIESAGVTPAAVVCLSPWVDLEATSASYERNAARDAVNSRELVRRMGEVAAAGVSDRRDPRLAPLHADLAGLPPLYIQVGGWETFLGEAEELAARAAAAGVRVRLEVFPAMQHCFQQLAGSAAVADEAVREIGSWLRARLGLA